MRPQRESRHRPPQRYGWSSPDPRACGAHSWNRQVGKTKPALRKGKQNLKSKFLGKIQESVEMSKLVNLSTENTRENEETKHSELEDKPVERKSHQDVQETHQESTLNLKNRETTSGSSLPTGISFLNYSQDSSFSSETSISSSSHNDYLSPEVQRGGYSNDESEWRNVTDAHNEDWLRKNSTLLESSKAVDINLLPEPDVSEFFKFPEGVNQMGHYKSKSSMDNPSQEDHSSKKLHVSTIVSGKKLYKIKSQKGTTPSDFREPSPIINKETKKQFTLDTHLPDKCSKNQVNFNSPKTFKVPVIKYIGERKVDLSERIQPLKQDKFSHKQTEYSAPPRQGLLLTSTPATCPQDLVLELSPVDAVPLDEELIPNASGPFVHSSEIAPSSSISAVQDSQMQVTRETKNICCIITAPFCNHPSRIIRVWTEDELPSEHTVVKDIILTS